MVELSWTEYVNETLAQRVPSQAHVIRLPASVGTKKIDSTFRQAARIIQDKTS